MNANMKDVLVERERSPLRITNSIEDRIAFRLAAEIDEGTINIEFRKSEKSRDAQHNEQNTR